MVVSLFSYWMKHIFSFSVDFCKKKKIIKVCMQVVLQFLLFPLLNLLMFKTKMFLRCYSMLILNHKFTIKQLVGPLKIYIPKGVQVRDSEWFAIESYAFGRSFVTA